MAVNILTLPIDQRYTISDMKYMADRIESMMEDITL